MKMENNMTLTSTKFDNDCPDFRTGSAREAAVSLQISFITFTF